LGTNVTITPSLAVFILCLSYSDQKARHGAQADVPAFVQTSLRQRFTSLCSLWCRHPLFYNYFTSQDRNYEVFWVLNAP